jgi:plastocyanin
LKRELLTMAGVVAVFVAGGVALMQSGLLPEERAQDFNALEQISLQNENIVIKEPTEGDNTYIYALSTPAKEAWEIASQDEEVKAILARAEGSAVTIAAVQPTAFVDSEGKVTHSGSGQIRITSNLQLVEGSPYTSSASYSDLAGSEGQSRQNIWNVFVDMNRRAVTDIAQERERVMVQTLRDNVVFGGMNMYLPEMVEAQAGSTIRWLNDSNLPHNVVGTYSTDSGDTKVDSGFFDNNESFQYTFGEAGTFVYHCTIHTDDGMKGTIAFN